LSSGLKQQVSAGDVIGLTREVDFYDLVAKTALICYKGKVMEISLVKAGIEDLRARIAKIRDWL
jgi:hypothetical protein